MGRLPHITRFLEESMLPFGMERLRPLFSTITLLVLLCGAPMLAQADSESQHSAADASDVLPAASTWKGAIVDSFRLLIVEHATRVVFQDKTRRELAGPFLQDYGRSLKVPDSWSDGDSWPINYVGHPIHGAAAGFIWLDHEDGAHDPDLGFSREYWTSRARATAWSAYYSLQFEIGPVSEASIGNVGMHPNTIGWVDHVATPVGALGFMVAEDALDRYLITRIESWTSSRFLRRLSRIALNPSRTMSNAVQGRSPWYRVGRPLR
jgi:hypothetical protein